ncbi:hypothetical protein HK405_012823, partial [Cladochytrium tenue]
MPSASSTASGIHTDAASAATASTINITVVARLAIITSPLQPATSPDLFESDLFEPDAAVVAVPQPSAALAHFELAANANGTEVAVLPRRPRGDAASSLWASISSRLGIASTGRHHSQATAATSAAASIYPDEPQPVSALAVPALFGRSFDHSVGAGFLAPVLVLDGVDACSPFRVPLPDAVFKVPAFATADAVGAANQEAAGTNSDVAASATAAQPDPPARSLRRPYPVRLSDVAGDAATASITPPETSNPTTAKVHVDAAAVDSAAPPADLVRLRNWFALLPRGGCPFDVKAFHARAAGLAGAIVHNTAPPAAADVATGAAAIAAPDVPVRMAANSLGAEVAGVHALFLTHADAARIAAAAAAEDDDGNGDGAGTVGGSGGAGVDVHSTVVPVPGVEADASSAPRLRPAA